MILDDELRSRQKEFLEGLLGLMPRGVRHFRPLPPYFTGYEYQTLYDWDQYFEGIILAYCGYPLEYVRNGIRIFMGLQREDGYIPRSFTPGVGVYYKHDVEFKPFLAQLCLLTVRQDSQLDWLVSEGIYERLCRFYTHWTTVKDVRKQGLSVWHECEHTGMDNHTMRAGRWGVETDFCEGVDLNAYLVREAEALAVLSTLLGKTAEAQSFRESAEARRQAMQRWLWDEKTGFFFDYHVRENRLIPVTYAGSFAALWAKVPTEAQAQRIVQENLLDPAKFWRPYPVPVLAANTEGYSEGFLPGERNTCCNWRAHTWMPVNYMTVHGLGSYGYHELANELAIRSLQLFDRGHFSEYYTSEQGIGTGLRPFWGWSALAIFLPTETERHLDPTTLDSERFDPPLSHIFSA